MTVTLHTSRSAPAEADADAIVIGVTQTPDGPRAAPGAEAIAAALALANPGGGTIDLTAQLSALGATGKAEEVSKIVTVGRLGVPLVVTVGLGSASPDGPGTPLETLRRAAGTAIRELLSSHSTFVVNDRNKAGNGKARRIAVALPAAEPEQAEAVTLGALLGGYSFRRYRATQAADAALTLFTTHDAAADRGRVLAAAMTMVRDLVNTPPADLVPADLAEVATRVASDSGLAIQVFDENELAKDGYGGIMAVGMGSVHPPRLVRLEYTHPEASKTVVLAGKGITFDSGGLSLKPSKSMETMKADMGGAAAVLGAIQAIAALRPAANVISYLCLAENMPGGGAQRPSDVITIYGGKTVEVLNTDAEGRLVLADALARSGADGPDLLVDVATLTGAQTVALGNRTAGVMASDDGLAAAVADVAKQAGEAMWPMPLPDDLRKGLDSSVADIANVSADRAGGMLVAGLFLREFVPQGTRWVHLDIAGPAYNDGGAYGYTTKGGTGMAVRTLVRLVEDVAEDRLTAG
ncbi:MAG TPA: leucyl aminopeptidase [Streptosporangiaceae bacterium]